MNEVRTSVAHIERVLHRCICMPSPHLHAAHTSTPACACALCVAQVRTSSLAEAHEAWESGEWEIAEQALGAALAVCPEDISLLSQRSRVHLKQSDCKSALKDTKDMVHSYPRAARAHRGHGLALCTRF